MPIAEPLGHQHLDRTAEQLGTGITEQQLGLLVHHPDDAAGVDHHHGVGRGLDEQPETFFQAFVVRALLDVPQGALDARHQSAETVLQDEVGGAQLQRLGGAVFADMAGHQDERQARRGVAHQLQRLHAVERRQVIVGDHQVGLQVLQLRV